MKSYKLKRITIDEFLFGVGQTKNEFLLNPSQAKICYNLKTQEGSLVQGNGFEELTLPQEPNGEDGLRKLFYSQDFSIKKIWRYKYYSEVNSCDEYVLICFGSDNRLHFTPLFAYTEEFFTITDFEFNQTPTALNFRVGGRDVMGFCSPTDEFLVWYCDESPYLVNTVPKFDCICLHNERLFAIDSEKNYLVRYSSNLNPLDWKSSVTTTSGGSIELNDFKGSLKNLISFLDNVFVFRDFGISKISSYVASSHFAAVNIYSSSSKLFCNTACICGDAIFFLAEDGLYKFDGFNVARVDNSFSHLFKNRSQENAVTCFFDGKLYIACNLNFGDESFIGVESTAEAVNNALIEYDINAKTYNITRGVDITSMLAVKDQTISKLFVCLNGELGYKIWQLNNLGKLGEEVLYKCWQGGKINFENFDKNKILKEVYLSTKYDCVLKIKTDKTVRTYQIFGNDKTQRVRINLKGKYFSFSFESSNENVFISNPQFIFNEEN